jgi:Phosphoesterase family/Putative Ig domain/Abnormal spindle-like microcephaly-assoc'd, ASPM-SPD-2-Hydin/Immunoglobulin domain
MRGKQIYPGSRAESPFPNPKIWMMLKNCVLVSLAALSPVLLNGCAGSANSTSTPGTPPSTLAITNVQNTPPTTSTAQIVWTTNVPSDSAVNYGTSPSYGSSTPVDPAMVTNHQVTLSGLAAGTTYYYQVTSTDSKGNRGKSDGHPFKTSGFGISGTISPATGGSGATLTLSGAASATTTADSSGNYSFSGLPNGTYTIVATHQGFTFTPSSQNATVNGANVTGVSFTDTAASVAPAITTQPTNQTVTAGQTATFPVVASGTAPLSYQWQRNGVNISGATAASYTTPATTTADSGATFRVVVSTTAGTVTSAAATLTVTAAATTPTITTQPANQTVTAGQTATFAVVATGTAPLSYQWQKNGVNISGATAASYTTPATTTADSGATFRVVVSNTAGTVTSAAATLTVTAAAVAPSITTQPANQTVTAGQTATFSVAATGTAPLSYQWNKNGSTITGATSSSYTTPATTSSDSGSSFAVVVSNSAGSVTSNTATLTVNAVAPAVSFSPTSLTFGNQTVGTSSSAQFVTFSNTGTGTLTFGTEPITGDYSSAGQGTCSTSLAAGASCTMSVKFTPTATGTRTGTLTANDNASSSPQVVTLTGTGVTPTPPPTTGLFGHVAIVVEENTNYSSVTSSSMPYLSGLMSQYGLATQYYANTHPSIGNYFMLTTGQILTNDDAQTPSSFPVSVDNVVRELVAAGKTWKAYAESLPSVGYIGGDSTSGGGQYYVRHVPIAYLTDVQNSSTQRQNLVPFNQLAQDLSTGSLPNYSFIAPNGCDDAHDCGLGTADNWLKTNIDSLIKNSVFQKDGLLIIVFDESSNDNTNGGGRVVCTLISPAFSKLGYQSTTLYQHESVLRLTLEGLGVTLLPGAATSAPAMWEFFNTTGGGTPPAPLAIATTSVPNGTVGQAYGTQLNATGGTSPYTWSVSSGALPSGLTLSGAGVIGGSPTTAGSSTFAATVSDPSSQTTSSSFTLTVSNLTTTACALYVSPSGSDSNPGTLSAPWQTPQKAANSAAAGQTVCFRGGSYPQTVTVGYQQSFNNSGAPGNPIVFTNYPGETAILQGSTRINGSYLTFRGTPQGTGSCDAINHCGLIFEGSQGYNIDAIDICCATTSAPHFVLFDHVEIRNATYHAGLYQEGCNNAIVGSYVHDNGAFNANRSEDNGIYWSTTSSGCTNGGLIANNVVENNYSKGIQLYDGGSATSPANVTVIENTSVNNGAQGAVVWGDHNVFVNNILYNNNNLSGGAAAGAQGGLYSGSANLVDKNLTFDPTGNSGWDNPSGCCITNNKQGDPLFLSSSGLDWHILATSPAISFSNLNYIQPVDKDGVSRGTLPAAGAYQH